MLKSKVRLIRLDRGDQINIPRHRFFNSKMCDDLPGNLGQIASK